MRIAVTHPTAWPEVRRGSERLLHDLSHRLAARGHRVTVVTSAPGTRARSEREGAVERLILPRRNPPSPIAGRWFNGFHLFGLDLARLLATEGFEAVHCLNYHDAAGALAARHAGARFRLVFQCTGIPVRRYFRRIPLDGLLFRQAVRRSDAVAVLSHFAKEALARDYGVAGHLLPSPTETAPFEIDVPAPAEPRILFTGDADEPRKGALLLARAFPAIAERLPGARLIYSGKAGDAVRAGIAEVLPESLRGRVEILGVGRVEDLPALYAGATVCVNPAIWEALGNVLIEALAAGTPVVGARHGGIPDIVSEGRTGFLFDPGSVRGSAVNVAGLADAVVRAAELAGHPQTRAACRAQARSFGWDALAGAYEGLIAGPAPAAAAVGALASGSGIPAR